MNERPNTVKISRLLADSYSQRILSYTYRKSMSAQRLSKICRIPIAACYRRINDLEKAGLILISEETEIRKGRRVKLYRCGLKSATLRFLHGRFRLEYNTSNGGCSIDPIMNVGNVYSNNDINCSESKGEEREKLHITHQSN